MIKKHGKKPPAFVAALSGGCFKLRHIYATFFERAAPMSSTSNTKSLCIEN